MSAHDIYVTLQSCASAIEYPSNRFSKFRNNLPSSLHLDAGEWVVSLLDISLPIRYFNLQAHTLAFVVPILTPKNSTAIGNYNLPYDQQMETMINTVVEEEFQDSDSQMYHSPGSPGGSPKKPRTSKIIRICRTARLLPSYNTSISELGASIVQLFQKTFKDLIESEELLAELRFTYVPITNTASLHSKELAVRHDEDDEDDVLRVPPIQIYAKNKTLLQYHLGLNIERKTIGRSGDYYFVDIACDEELRSNFPCNLKMNSKLYVCCDCIEYSSVGNNVVKLLTSIPVSRDKKITCSHLTYLPSPRYHSVHSQHIDSIEIELLSSLVTRELFPSPMNPSDSEYVECTLHFKRVSDLVNI